MLLLLLRLLLLLSEHLLVERVRERLRHLIAVDDTLHEVHHLSARVLLLLLRWRREVDILLSAWVTWRIMHLSVGVTARSLARPVGSAIPLPTKVAETKRILLSIEKTGEYFEVFKSR